MMAVKRKKPKEQKKHNKKNNLRFENYKDCLFNNKIIRKSQLTFKSDRHEVYTQEVNKVALKNKDNKREQTFNEVTTYPYRTPAVKVCESEMMVVRNFFVEKYEDFPLYHEIVLKR